MDFHTLGFGLAIPTMIGLFGYLGQAAVSSWKQLKHDVDQLKTDQEVNKTRFEHIQKDLETVNVKLDKIIDKL